MRQLTHDQFDALPNNKPLDVQADGAPPFGHYMLIWYDGEWEYAGYCAMGWKLGDAESARYLEIEKHGRYHKLPDDIKES